MVGTAHPTRLLSIKMMIKEFLFYAEVIIFFGLIMSGSLFALGLFIYYSRIIPLGILGGWFFGMLSLIMYFFSLITALMRNAAKQFWDNLSTLNFGLTLVAIIIMFSRIEHVIVLAWLCLIGIALSVFFYRGRIVDYRYGIIIIHFLFFLPVLPVFEPFVEAFTLPAALVFVIVPIFYIVCDKPCRYRLGHQA